MSRSRPALSNKLKIVLKMLNMTKTQDGVPGIIKVPRFHVKKSRDTAYYVLSLIMSRLAFAASFVVCDMHMTKIFMIFKSQLRFRAELLMSFLKIPLKSALSGSQTWQHHFPCYLRSCEHN